MGMLQGIESDGSLIIHGYSKFIAIAPPAPGRALRLGVVASENAG